jgi:o-succinylbenzoate synthase
MVVVQPLIISEINFSPFKFPLIEPLVIAGNAIHERNGFYLSIKTSDGLKAQGEIAPLEGISPESPGRVRHDIKQIRAYGQGLKIPRQKDELLDQLRHEPHLMNACGSMRFAVESALLMLASGAANQSMAEFLGGNLRDVKTAALLQGSHQKVISDVKQFSGQGTRVFKLKVGDRNIALDVKKVNDIRVLLDQESYLRLDANRQWNLQEACIFAELIGNQKIDFIEEPVKDIAQLDAFYQKTGMRVALDESLGSSALAGHEGVVAYVLKPMILGLIPTLDWIEKARLSKHKAIISSAFESPVGFKVLANLACFSGQIAGMGTERWLKNIKPIAGENGIIKKEFLV